MRNLLTVGLLSIGMLAGAASAGELKTEKEQISYIIGYSIGKNMDSQGVEIDSAVFQQALKEGLEGKKSRISTEEAQKIKMAYGPKAQKRREDKMKALGDKNDKAGKAYLAENGKKQGVVTTASGLQYKVITEGKGDSPKATDTVTVNYKGTLIDGTEFDSSYSRGQPASFPVGGVIKGWTEALQLMKPGAKWQLAIPEGLAYGDHAPDTIGPKSTLLFEVELISAKPAEDKKPAAATPGK